MRPLTVTTPLPSACGRLEGVDDLARLRDLVLAGREHVVARLELARVDERLAVEAHLATLQALGARSPPRS